MPKTNSEQSAGESGTSGDEPHQHRAANLRNRAVSEAKHFLALFVYLWILFGLFVLNERIILHQHKIDFLSHGFALLNALVLAKVMLILDDLHVARWLDDRPLIYPILYNSFIFSVLFLLFHVIEEIVVGMAEGDAAAASVPSIGGGGFAGVVCVAVILFFSLVPFFAFRSLARALGLHRLNSMLFGGRAGERTE